MNRKISGITGVILAGGRSSRFGSNKALAPWGSQTMIERVASAMGAVFDDLLVVTNSPLDYANLGLSIARDRTPYQGPLGGIVTAFHATAADSIFAVACDMPLVDPAVIRDVCRQGRGFHAAVPVHDGWREYLMALYSRRLFPAMELNLKRGELSLDHLCRASDRIAWIPAGGSCFWNVNRPADLAMKEHGHAH